MIQNDCSDECWKCSSCQQPVSRASDIAHLFAVYATVFDPEFGIILPPQNVDAGHIFVQPQAGDKAGCAGLRLFVEALTQVGGEAQDVSSSSFARALQASNKLLLELVADMPPTDCHTKSLELLIGLMKLRDLAPEVKTIPRLRLQQSGLN